MAISDSGGGSLPPEDLTQDRLLDRLTRDAQGRPMLGGIPLIRRIGRGGMGSVYYGVHPRLGVEVAVKVLPFHLVEQDPKLVERFASEARIAAVLSDNHLVRVLDVNHEHDTHFLVMEFVPGESAGGYLKRVKTVSERDALDIVTAATRGLAVAHERGIIHRDIKPDNILIPKGELRKSKLSDLGLAKPEGGGQSIGTASHIAMGTPGYMAPEQVEDAKTAGTTADVFSMGATLYALLSGSAPFKGSSLGVILRDTAVKEPDPLPSTVSQGVRAIVARCMAKEPAKRFANGSVLLKALEGLATGETPVTIPEPTLMPMPALSERQRVEGPESKKAKSPLPLVIAAVVLIAGAAIVFATQGAKPTPSAPSPTVVAKVESSSPKVEPSPAISEEKRKSYRDFMQAAEGAQILAGAKGTVEAWQSVADGAKKAGEYAQTDDERKRARDLSKLAEDKVLALRAASTLEGFKQRIAATPGRFQEHYDECQALIEQLGGTPSVAELREIETSLRKTIDAELAKAQRKKDYDAWAGKAAAEKDPAAALALWKKAVEFAPGAKDLIDAEAHIEVLKKEVARIAEEARVKAAYDAAMADGAEAETRKEYAKAKSAYEKALGLKPGDAAATRAIDGVRKIVEEAARVAAEARAQAAYDAAMAEGARSEAERDFAKAKAAYDRALAARPSDPGAAAAIKAIEKRLNRTYSIKYQPRQGDQLIESSVSTEEEKGAILKTTAKATTVLTSVQDAKVNSKTILYDRYDSASTAGGKTTTTSILEPGTFVSLFRAGVGVRIEGKTVKDWMKTIEMDHTFLFGPKAPVQIGENWDVSETIKALVAKGKGTGEGFQEAKATLKDVRDVQGCECAIITMREDWIHKGTNWVSAVTYDYEFAVLLERGYVVSNRWKDTTKLTITIQGRPPSESTTVKTRETTVEVRDASGALIGPKLDELGKAEASPDRKPGSFGGAIGVGPDGKGAVVNDVTAGGPAEKAGLKKGDVILKVNGRETPTASEVIALIRSMKEGDNVVVQIQREGKNLEAKVTLGARPVAPAEAGPEPAPVKARILVIVAEYSFVIVDKGEPDGIKVGSKFQIVRKGKGEVQEILGEAVLEKFIDSAKNTQSKLKITKGDVAKLQFGDEAVLIAGESTEPANFELILDADKKIKMEFVLIKAGKFTMGGKGSDFEVPHVVTLKSDFWMQTTETTQLQWEALMKSNPSKRNGPDLPVEQVSWGDAQLFCTKLSAICTPASGKWPSLPTEAEWEYACRAGTTTDWHCGSRSASLREYGWGTWLTREENPGRSPHPVAQKNPNPWGLYDMHGNVTEWCRDWFTKNLGDATDPTGSETGTDRCIRGGSSESDSSSATSFARFRGDPASKDERRGFRVVLRLTPK